MTKKGLTYLLLLISATLFSAQAMASEYIVLANGSFNAKHKKELAEAGGTLVKEYTEIGVAIYASDHPAFADAAAKIPGVAEAAQDLELQWLDHPNPYNQEIASITFEEAAALSPPNTNNDDWLFDLQWGHDAIDAPEAWEKGVRGAGARVAVLDGGFDLDHPDLAENINLDLSANFIAGETLQFAGSGISSHGSHTAGTIAAADNGIGTIGVAPEAELVLVKVLRDSGSGPFSSILGGMIHAANVDADIISMSLGASLPRNYQGISTLFNALSRAANYAYHQGSLVIVAAGNDSRNLDHDTIWRVVPAELPHVVIIGSTAPVGWAVGGNMDLRPSYSNYGKGKVNFTAPGGGYDAVFQGLTGPCSVAGYTLPCYLFDFVLSTGNNGWYFSVGTSMATPHAAGIAALIVSANGGSMHPDHIRKALLLGSEDLGQPGRDDDFAQGRLNANQSLR